MIPASASPAGNAPEWTVSELAGALRRTLEDRFGLVRIRGELGKVNRHSSGHVYLDIKDEGACIAGVMWRTAAAKSRVRLEQGMEVVATGRITTFPGQSKYQINIETIEPAGIGALMALLDERRRALEAEGLFAASRKRRPPFLPEVIGIVTSPTGAVIHDILHRLADRFPRRVVVWPVRVQGETCGPEVAAAIAGLNAFALGGVLPRPDVIIVARGGGSLEDLWGFNEEAVVRAAAASAVPLISAVGHETDWTLLDHAADLRAPTPTGAAEMAVPVRADLVAQVASLELRRGEAGRRLLDARRAEVRSAARALSSPEALLSPRRQRLDLLSARLPPALLANAREHETALRLLERRLARHSPRVELARFEARLARAAGRPGEIVAARLALERGRLLGLSERLAGGRGALLRAERVRIERGRDRLADLSARAGRALSATAGRREARLSAASGLLSSLGYRAVLARGYALVRDAAGRPVSRADEAVPGRRVEIEFADGRRRALVEGTRGEHARGAARPQPLVQAGLFDD